jgi:hypothetical protein
MKKTELKNINDYFANYIKNVKEEDVIEALENSLNYALEFIPNIPSEKLDYRYLPEKWSIKEILIHLIDSERILSYRALRFARNDKNELLGYDQDEYIKYSGANKRSIADILEDFSIARKANVILFKSFNDEMLSRTGIANKREISVITLGFLLSGHLLHHLNVIKEKYLS